MLLESTREVPAFVCPPQNLEAVRTASRARTIKREKQLHNLEFTGDMCSECSKFICLKNTSSD